VIAACASQHSYYLNIATCLGTPGQHGDGGIAHACTSLGIPNSESQAAAYLKHTMVAALQDPLKKVADTIVSRYHVLCLDELLVSDVADAMILNRLFARLFDQGLTLVATSNREPSKLYEGGLQRPLFVPFIHRIERECIVHSMDSTTDYRLLATRTVGSYFVRLVEGHTNDDRLAAVLRHVRLIHLCMIKHSVMVRKGMLPLIRASSSFASHEVAGAHVCDEC
jgi:hypothetical protein